MRKQPDFLGREVKECLELEEGAQSKVWRRGLQLRVNVFMTGKTRWKKENLHWQFFDLNLETYVMDYWPVSGTWRCARTLQSGREMDLDQVIEQAVLCGMAIATGL
jgi:hypothetical protein